MVFIKEFFKDGLETNITQTTLHCVHSVYLKWVFNIAVRCETAIKTNEPLNKHYQLGVGPNRPKLPSDGVLKQRINSDA